MFLGLFLLLAVLVCVAIYSAWRNRKEKNEAYRRAGRIAEERLPDRQNEYLRSRLQTALAQTKGENVPCDAKLSKAEKLLRELKRKKLSGADSLLVRKLQKEIGMYASKEYIAPYKKEKIPASLTMLLTLCAKYEVE